MWPLRSLAGRCALWLAAGSARWLKKRARASAILTLYLGPASENFPSAARWWETRAHVKKGVLRMRSISRGRALFWAGAWKVYKGLHPSV